MRRVLRQLVIGGVAACLVTFAGIGLGDDIVNTDKIAASSEPLQDENRPHLAISVSKEKIEVLTPVIVTATIKNDGDRDIVLTQVTDGDLELEVKYDNGIIMPLTRYGQTQLGPRRDGSLRFLTIKPGESVTATVPVNQLYDMTLPGHYTIVAKRTFYYANGKKAGAALLRGKSESIISAPISVRIMSMAQPSGAEDAAGKDAPTQEPMK